MARRASCAWRADLVSSMCGSMLVWEFCRNPTFVTVNHASGLQAVRRGWRALIRPRFRRPSPTACPQLHSPSRIQTQCPTSSRFWRQSAAPFKRWNQRHRPAMPCVLQLQQRQRPAVPRAAPRRFPLKLPQLRAALRSLRGQHASVDALSRSSLRLLVTAAVTGAQTLSRLPSPSLLLAATQN